VQQRRYASTWLIDGQVPSGVTRPKWLRIRPHPAPPGTDAHSGPLRWRSRVADTPVFAGVALPAEPGLRFGGCKPAPERLWTRVEPAFAGAMKCRRFGVAQEVSDFAD